MRPLPGAPDVVSQKSDTRSKGYPLFRFGTGAKEAVDLLTRSEFVGGKRVRNREQTHIDLTRFRPPEG